jgi:hypothetical protein
MMNSILAPWRTWLAWTSEVESVVQPGVTWEIYRGLRRSAQSACVNALAVNKALIVSRTHLQR